MSGWNAGAPKDFCGNGALFYASSYLVERPDYLSRERTVSVVSGSNAGRMTSRSVNPSRPRCPLDG